MTRDEIRSTIEHLDALHTSVEFGKLSATEGSESAQQLVDSIRSQQNYLNDLRSEYISAVRLLLQFMFRHAAHVQSVVEGNRLLSELGEEVDATPEFALFLGQFAKHLIRMGDHENAVKQLYRSHRIQIALQMEGEELFRTTISLGILYAKLNEFEKAEECFLNALEQAEKSQIQERLGAVYLNLGTISQKSGNLQQAIEYGEKSLAPLQGHRAFPTAQNNLASVWYELSKLDKATELFEKALALSVQYDDQVARKNSLTGLASIAAKRGEFVRAIELQQEALELSRQIGGQAELYEGYKGLSEIHSKAGNAQEALRYHQLFHDAYVDVYDQTKQEIIHNLEVKHRTEVAQLELQSALEREALLQASNAKLMVANNELTELLKIITHDLFNPLQAIMVRSHMASTHIDQQNPRDALEMINKLDESAQFMKNLIAQVQRMSIVDDGQFDITSQPHSLQSALADAIERNRLIAQSKGIEIRTEATEDWTVLSNQTILQRIFDNLLSNNIKYSRPNSQVTVRSRFADEQVAVDFIDYGVGIAPEEKARLFTRFGRLPSSEPTADEHSTGLGLYITARLVKAIGGKIAAYSDGLGQGATFTVHLPVTASHARL